MYMYVQGYMCMLVYGHNYTDNFHVRGDTIHTCLIFPFGYYCLLFFIGTLKKNKPWAKRERVQQLKVFAALLEDL